MRSFLALGTLLSAAVVMGCGSTTIVGGGGSGNTGTGGSGGEGATGAGGSTGGSGMGGQGAGGASLCGNLSLDETEDCDGALLGGVTCLALGFDGGDLGCAADGINPQPFCNFRDASRAGNDWDLITLDTSAVAGQQGQLRVTYNTADGCCGFERGWFLDNLSFGGCADPAFP